MRCGMCKKNDPSITIDHVKSCDGVTASAVAVVDVTEPPQWPASDAQIKYVLGLQEERNLPDWWPTRTANDLRFMERDEVSADINQLKTFTKNAKAQSSDAYKPTMPAGRYALLRKGNYGADAVWMFYEVTDGKGRWKGYKFLKRLIGAPGQYQKNPVGASERPALFKAIEADPNKAMTDYGLQSKVCGKCASPLSDPVSIARGIGPKCLSKLGW